MNYKCIWKMALSDIVIISAIMIAPSILKIYELTDSMTRILGMVDIIALFILVFSFIKSYKNL